MNALFGMTAIVCFFLLSTTEGQAASKCATKYANCQQTCKDNSVGGKNFGVTLWDSSRSKDCFNGCSTERMQCKAQTSTSGEATKSR